MQMAQQIALHHHERWDGQGYPHGLNGSDIPLVARIVAVADSFDALTHPRPYKEAWSIPEALAELQRERGWQFDPDVVDALVRVQRQGALANA
jgi:putative two-component system response regulator